MKEIIKKELSYYFNTPIGFILLALFSIFANFLFVRDLFIRQTSSTLPYFEVLPWLLLFLTGGLAMRSIAEEKKRGTLEILLTLPLSESKIILGKAAANLIFLFFSFLLSLGLFLTLSFLGELDAGALSAGFLGAFLLGGSMLSLGIFLSSLTKSQIAALLATLFTLFWLLVLGTELVLSSLPKFFAPLFRFLSLLSHFDNFARGVIDLRDLFYYLTFIIVFLFLAVKNLERRE